MIELSIFYFGSLTIIHIQVKMRGPGFEPGLTPRKGVVLPLDYPR